MMKIKTAELIGPALDWAVAKAEGLDVFIQPVGNLPNSYWVGVRTTDYQRTREGGYYYPSTNWAAGGPIIERDGLVCEPFKGDVHNWSCFEFSVGHAYKGPTPLVAAMRCLVASKLGDEVDVPRELSRTKENMDDLARVLFQEVEDSFETVHGIADQYGVATLVDLWWLASVLVKGEGSIAQNHGSQLAQVLERLPSGKLFMQYVDTEFCKN